MGRALLAFLGAALLAISAAGCQYGDPEPFSEPFWVVGGEIDADTLNRGMESYTLYCYACHGWHGDGNGPASFALRPPPRDFRNGLFKFAGAAEGDGLPHDVDIVHIRDRFSKIDRNRIRPVTWFFPKKLAAVVTKQASPEFVQVNGDHVGVGSFEDL